MAKMYMVLRMDVLYVDLGEPQFFFFVYINQDSNLLENETMVYPILCVEFNTWECHVIRIKYSLERMFCAPIVKM